MGYALDRRCDQTNTLCPRKVEKVTKAGQKPNADLIPPKAELVELAAAASARRSDRYTHALMSAAFFSKALGAFAAVPLSIEPTERTSV